MHATLSVVRLAVLGAPVPDYKRRVLAIDLLTDDPQIGQEQRSDLRAQSLPARVVVDSRSSHGDLKAGRNAPDGK